MKLTIDLIEKSTAFINTLKDREIDFRDNRIPAIENLAVMRDQNDSIDFTNNDIKRLENFPLSPRLRTLLLSNNRLQFIDRTVAGSIPNLECLILNNNSLSELSDIEPLSAFKKLRYLSLIDNPVTQHEQYRQFVIFHNPLLKMLDFCKVTKQERQAAEKLFSSATQPDLSNGGVFEVGNISRQSFSASQSNGSLTEEERFKIKQAIADAKSLDEVTRLERILQSGKYSELKN